MMYEGIEEVKARYDKEVMLNALRCACSLITNPICPLEIAIDCGTKDEFLERFRCEEECEDNTSGCWAVYLLETVKVGMEGDSDAE